MAPELTSSGLIVTCLLLTMSFLRLAVRSVVRPRIAAAALPSTRGRILQSASYAAAAGLSKEQVTSRVLDVLKGFEKVDQGKVSY
jgi:NADH dehydrogenase (ubiquinone) 1 alpha/beta subcomplex 1, acyl-carrier protein